jgi:hypothetical protein
MVNHRLERGDRILADIDGHGQALARIDYDPFDDEIEIVLSESESVRHLLIERPCQVRVPDDDDAFSIEVVSGVDSIVLKDVTSPIDHRPTIPHPPIPPELEGAYFGG